MPGVTVKNQTTSTLNIAFSISTPLAFRNELKPEDTIRLNLAAFRHHFEARVDTGWNRFSTEQSLTKIAEIGTACLMGTAAVAVGTAWLTGKLGGHVNPAAFAGAGAAWGAAHAMGARYGQPGEAAVVVVPGLWVPMSEKHYSIRVFNNRFALWDDDEDRLIV